MKPGIYSTEFWMTLAAQAVAVLTMMGYIAPADANTVSGATSNLITGCFTIAGAVAILLKYIHSRQELKAEVLKAIVFAIGLALFASPSKAQAQFALPYRQQQDRINQLQKQVNDLQLALSQKGSGGTPAPTPIIVMPPAPAPAPVYPVNPIISPPLQNIPLGGPPYQQIPLGGSPYQQINLGGQPYHLIPLGNQPFQQIQIGNQPYQVVPLNPTPQVILNPGAGSAPTPQAIPLGQAVPKPAPPSGVAPAPAPANPSPVTPPAVPASPSPPQVVPLGPPVGMQRYSVQYLR